MAICRASLILPGCHLEEFPTHLLGDRAEEILAAWTALWHPAILSTIGALPTWHPAGSPPEPDSLEGELVIIPAISGERLPRDWREQFQATYPRNPPLVEPLAERRQMVAAVLEAAALDLRPPDVDVVGDFLALGYAYLQIELLTRAMRHAKLLDTGQFATVVVEAARAAIDGNEEGVHEGLTRAFDLLGDTRNHYYPVDFFLVDVTLLSPDTLGEPLRAKLAGGMPTSLLAPADLIEQMARHHPATFEALQRAIEAGSACVVGGRRQATAPGYQSLEGMLAELEAGRRVYEQHLGRGVEVFAQYESAFSPVWPELLTSLGFKAALQMSFDGGNVPRAEQPKSWWKSPGRSRIESLSATPQDAARPETWLAFAKRISDSIAHDHVATLLFAGWPGYACQFADDLRRASRYSSVLGKLVTLDEYFRVSRKVDDWITFQPRDYPRYNFQEQSTAPLSSRVDAYRRDNATVYQGLAAGLSAIVPLDDDCREDAAAARVVVNPWSFSCSRFIDADVLASGSAPSCLGGDREGEKGSVFLSDIPACGFAILAAPAPPLPVPLADGHTLRNEHLEVVVSGATGGIQSLRRHGDRSTRVSQRLVVCDRQFSGRAHRAGGDDLTPEANVPMIAEHIEVTRSNHGIGEITSRGRLVDANNDLLAHFVQTTRLPRSLPAVILDIHLDLVRHPDGALRDSYYASRLVWRGDALGVRKGVDWIGSETGRQWIESSEWVEITEASGTITCFALGLPLHRLVSPTRLDTLLAVAGEKRQRFQMAVGPDCAYPTQTALALLSAGEPAVIRSVSAPPASRGWFLHASAKNVLVTHIAPLAAPRSGVRLRLLETEGRDAEVEIATIRPIRSAQITDFRGEPTEVVSVAGGVARVGMSPGHWLQLEAEW